MPDGVISFIMLICVIPGSNFYDLMCPPSSHWNSRAAQKCVKNPTYTCLWNALSQRNIEYCGQIEVAKLGYKFMLMPNPQQVPCSLTFYQPYKFTSDGSNQCTFRKSLCSDEGQILVSNGTGTADIRCRCDYRRNYVFVTPPRNKCTCVPSEEDCSCYYRQCKSNEILMKDYTCNDEKEDFLPENIPCEELVASSEKVEREIEANIVKNIESFSVNKRQITSVVLVIVLCVFASIVMFGIAAIINYVRPSVDVFEIKCSINLAQVEDLCKCTVLESDTVFLTWKLKSPLIKLKCFKVFRIHNDNIDDKTEVKQEPQLINGNKLTLRLENVTTADSGHYICIIKNKIGISNISFEKCWVLIGGFSVLQSCVFINVVSIKEDVTVISYVGNKCIVESNTVIPNLQVNAIKWMKRVDMGFLDIPISNNDKYRLVSETKPSLCITKCEWCDAGKYLCLVFDHEGNIIERCSFQKTLNIKEQENDAVYKHRQDKTFVRIDIIDKIQSKLRAYGVIIISGRSGTGKSKICLEIASDYLQKKYKISEMHTLMHVFESNDLETLFTLYINKIDLGNFVKLKELVETLPSSSKILIKCKYCCLDHQQHYLQDSNIYHQNIDFCLANDEKRKILKKHMNVNNIIQTSPRELNLKDQTTFVDPSQRALDNDTVESILKTEPWEGFPKSAHLFCSDIQLLQEGPYYFLDPPETLVNIVKNLFNSATVQSDLKNKQKFCILVYILDSQPHHLSFFKFDTKLFDQIWEKLFGNFTQGMDDCLEEAAGSMVGNLLRYEADIYEFIHPCLIAAVVMAAPQSLLKEFISRAVLTDILNYVGRKVIASATDFLFGHYHDMLLKRLEKEILKDLSQIKTIGKYIYNRWIKYEDLELKKSMLKYSDKILCEENPKQNLLSAWAMISLIEEITLEGRDPWLYRDRLSVSILLFGLIAAAKRNYFIERKETFGILLSHFKNKLKKQEELFFKAMNSEIDVFGNTFLHYIVLFGANEPVIILDFLLSKKFKKLNKKLKDNYVKTLEIAAHLGKMLIVKIFFVKTNYVVKQRERILDVLKMKNENYPANEEQCMFRVSRLKDYTMNLSEMFAPDVLKYVWYGSKDDYLAIKMFLEKKSLTKDTKNIVKETLISTFRQHDVFLDL